MIGSLLQADFEEIIQAKDWDGLRDALSELDPADVAELIMDLPPEDEGIIFRVLPRERAADVFEHLPLDHQKRLVKSLGDQQLQSILNEMTPDDRTRLFEELPAEALRQLLDVLSPEELKEARALLGYPEGTVGRYMTPDYVALPPDITAREALERIRRVGRGKETLSVVYLVNERGKLLEDVRLGTIVLADPETMIGDIEERAPVSIVATEPVDDAIEAFEQYDRSALPVVDKSGVLLGIVTHDDMLEFAERRATKEIQQLGGMEALDEPYTSVSLLTMFRKRGIWLSILFVGQMLTATVMERFGVGLEKAIVLTLFIPLIISSGGNSGSQATSLIIRAMALGEVRTRDWLKVLKRELVCASLLGMWLGMLGLARVHAWHAFGWQDYTQFAGRVAITVSLALVGVVLWGSLVGSMLPFALRRLGLDPATSSAPFVATCVDVTGLMIYFGVATLMLRGTLL